MNHIDIKAYALGELGESEKRSAASHLAGCGDCREELDQMQVTLRTLTMLRDEEMPRRIAFVSDKVFEPRWWQRVFNPTFASACVLAGAIVFHGISNQGPSEAEIQARIDEAVSKQMDDRIMVMDQMNKRLLQQLKTASQLVSY